ncbi:aminoglycoside phosphotransferase family protein [Streptomyces sp. NBC_00572]|uniref:aminoglycoside phosphotransferase family protein n=1 Tax=Streptomyces sp. NBC_00572 TaxID=2903664 RepID=UPI00224E8467|nr:aminoglycoside phosphotransferase family protein [Streptomyces sp. NBC_00572]MCX4979755.1 aminoglycoside phosphotransferase family protein [Streptomyces sp. NBC_00572]
MDPTAPPRTDDRPAQLPPARLAAVAHAAAHGPGAPCRCASGLVGVLADRDDGTVVRHGGLVAKAHAPGTDTEAHRARLALAAHPAVSGVFLPPLPASPTVPAELDGRPVTLWPYGPPVDPVDPDAAPWEEAARLLALLHRTPPPPGLADRLPEMRAPVKAALAVDRMLRTAPDHPATATVLAAWRSVPDDAGLRVPGNPAQVTRLLCHGDFHLGQLVRDTGSLLDAPWRLIDVDDLGLGDPAWDLARPAAWFAAGILPPEVWSRFLGAYVAAGGPAVGTDPWVRLDVPARALTVQTAALALAKSTGEGRPLDEVEDVMIDTCARIAGRRTDSAPSAST